MQRKCCSIAVKQMGKQWFQIKLICFFFNNWNSGKGNALRLKQIKHAILLPHFYYFRNYRNMQMCRQLCLKSSVKQNKNRLNSSPYKHVPNLSGGTENSHISKNLALFCNMLLREFNNSIVTNIEPRDCKLNSQFISLHQTITAVYPMA